MKPLLLCMAGIAALGACATRQTDHFYILEVQPAATAPFKSAGTQVELHVVLPALVDRGEMVLNTSADTVRVLEHERWAAPLADQVSITLAQDVERRRPDLLVSEMSTGLTGAKIVVNVVQMSALQGDRVSIEANWRILHSRADEELSGSEVFTARLSASDYSAVARGLSACLGLLADRLAAEFAR